VVEVELLTTIIGWRSRRRVSLPEALSEMLASSGARAPVWPAVRQRGVIPRRTAKLTVPLLFQPEVFEYLVGSAAFKAVGCGYTTAAGSIPVHLRLGSPTK
jgi:hypothetical protein